ncbi:hypothetical protein YQE_09907, partial [Dendroctonus ponderosae]
LLSLLILTLGSRQLAEISGLSRSSVLKVLNLHKYHPYHLSLHQELHGDDFQIRVIFCQWAHERIELNPNFLNRVCFSDECSFTNYGAVNRHNMHYWGADIRTGCARPWTINVWCGILGEKLIGPYIIEGNLTGECYRNLLQNELSILLEDVDFQLRQIVASEVLNRSFKDQWIGSAGPISWPARSPDLTSSDFFCGVFLKEKFMKLYLQVVR